MRLSFWIWFLALSAWSLVARAASPLLVPPDLSQNMAACQSNLSQWGNDANGNPNATNCRVETWTSGSRQMYQVRFTAQGTWQKVGEPVAAQELCAPVPPSTSYTQPDTSKPLDQQCPEPPKKCEAPLVDDGTGKCVDRCAKDQGKSSGKGKYDVGVNPKVYASACQGSCLVNWNGGDVGFTRLVGGVRHYYAEGEYINAGSSCNPSDSQPQAPLTPSQSSSDGQPASNTDGTNASPCKSGEASGTVNNRPVCLGKDPTSGITFVTKTSNPVNAVSASGNVTEGTNSSPAEGSYDDYCKTHGSLTICSGTKFDSSSGTTGGFGTGTGTGDTGTGTGGTGTGTGSNSGTGTNQAVNCQGCATESTLAAIKGILDPAGNDGKGAVDGAGKAEDGYKPMQDSLTAMQGGNGPLKDLSWSFGGLFPASAQCSPFTLNVNGRAINQTATLDVCDWINLARSILGWLCYVLTAIGIYRIATGQKSQGEAV